VTGAVTGIAVLVVLVVVIAAAYVVAKRRAPRQEIGTPDANTEEVVGRLMAELRKWQAEAAHWKATAERLQRELDRR
jgi:hypothetical protein